MQAHTTSILATIFVGSVGTNTVNGQTSILPQQSTLNDHFGESLASDSVWMVVGDPQDSSEAPLRGSVHIYRNTDSTWTLHQRISPDVVPGAGLNIFFGSSVAIDGEWILVGAPGDDESDLNAGAVHVYQLDTNTGMWTQFDKLFSSLPQNGEHFGTSVAIDSTSSLALVGQLDDSNTGKLHPWIVIDAEGIDWIPLTSISNPSGETGSQFGVALELDNNTLIAGAPREGNSRGSAWIMTFNGNTSEFDLDTELQPDASVLSPRFGSAVSIAGPRAIVGSPHDGDGSFNGGSAYLFSKQTGDWNKLDKFAGTSTQAGDGFGSSVQIVNSSVVVGSPNHENQVGEAFSFDVTGSTAVQTMQLSPSDGVPQGYFGHSCLIATDNLVIGSIAYNNPDLLSGKIYLYAGVQMHGDFDSDYDLDINDLLLLIGSWGPCSSNCAPDLDGNGQVDILDLIEFIAMW